MEKHQVCERCGKAGPLGAFETARTETVVCQKCFYELAILTPDFEFAVPKEG